MSDITHSLRDIKSAIEMENRGSYHQRDYWFSFIVRDEDGQIVKHVHPAPEGYPSERIVTRTLRLVECKRKAEDYDLAIANSCVMQTPILVEDTKTVTNSQPPDIEKAMAAEFADNLKNRLRERVEFMEKWG